MLTVDDFNQSDLQRISSIPKSFKVTGLFFLLFCVPTSLLFGLLGLAKNGFGYWLTTFTLLAVFAIVGIFAIGKDYLLYYKDKTNQKKYRGIIKVVGKSKKNGDKVIFTDIPELKKINLYTNELFEKISIGDTLTIEISKFSKTLFRLDKDQFDLLHGH
jgi:hypothetical protein